MKELPLSKELHDRLRIITIEKCREHGHCVSIDSTPNAHKCAAVVPNRLAVSSTLVVLLAGMMAVRLSLRLEALESSPWGQSE